MTPIIDTLDRILLAALGLGLICLALLSGLPAFAPVFVRYGTVLIGFVLLVFAVVRSGRINSILSLKAREV